jgi:hypothetical protein
MMYMHHSRDTLTLLVVINYHHHVGSIISPSIISLSGRHRLEQPYNRSVRGFDVGDALAFWYMARWWRLGS